MVREADDPARLRTGELAARRRGRARRGRRRRRARRGAGRPAVAPGAGQYDRRSAGTDCDLRVRRRPAATGTWPSPTSAPGCGDYELDRLTDAGRASSSTAAPGAGAYRVGRLLAAARRRTAWRRSAAGRATPAASGVDAEWKPRRSTATCCPTSTTATTAATPAAWPGAGARERCGRRPPLGSVSLQGAWEDRDARFAPMQLRRTIFDYEAWGLGDRARRDGFLTRRDRQADAARRLAARRDRGRLDLAVAAGVAAARRRRSSRRRRSRRSGAWGGGAAGTQLARGARRSDAVDPLDISAASSATTSPGAWSRCAGASPTRRRAVARRRRRPAARAGLPFRGERRAAGRRARRRRHAGASTSSATWPIRCATATGGASATAAPRRLAAGTRLDGRDAPGGRRHAGGRSSGPDGPDETTRLARLDLAGRWDRTASDWSLGYRVDNSRTEVLDRQIVFVGESQGDFNEDGDFVGDDQGAYDVVLAGTDSLVATTAVRGDLRWRQGFAFLGARSWYGGWSTQTVASLEGRSTTDQVGRLLVLDPAVVFDNDAAVLGDLNFTQEISLLEHEPRFDLRGRFGYRQTRDRQFAAHPEDRLDRRWQATGSANLTARTTLRGRYAVDGERRESTEEELSARRSQDLTTRRLELGWQVAPGPDLRVGLQGERVTRSDAVSAVAQQEWALRPSARARLSGGWSTLLEARWSNVTSDEPAGVTRPYTFPYPGGNVESTLRLSWEPSGYLTLSASWFARRQGERGWQHDLRLESTARF